MGMVVGQISIKLLKICRGGAKVRGEATIIHTAPSSAVHNLHSVVKIHLQTRK